MRDDADASINPGASATITAGDSATAFGMSIAIGDLSGDGVVDMLAASQAFGSSAGRVWIFESP
jgi:hypothetical protein